MRLFPRYRIFKFLSLFLFGGFFAYSCGNPYDSFSEDFHPTDIYGLAPTFSSSLEDYAKKITAFDNQLEGNSYKKNSYLDLDLGGTGYSDRNPFSFETPAKTSLDEDEQSIQIFRNLKDVMDYGLVVGNLRMLVTVGELSGNDHHSVNTLVLPKDFTESDLTGESELIILEEGFSYKPNLKPRVSCSMAAVNPDSGELDRLVDLPQKSSMSPEDLENEEFHCPVNVLDIDYSSSAIELQVKTEPLPFYEETRRTIASLGTFGFDEKREYALLYELSFELETESGKKQFLIYSFFYVILPVSLTPPSELSSYKYVGSYQGNEYYLIRARHPMTNVRAQAALLQSAVGASKAYGVDINSAEEQAFIVARIPAVRTWIGLDDMTREGHYQPHAGGASFTAYSRSHYQNWNEPPNNDGNEDGIHLFRSNNGRWGDTEVEHAYPILIEAEFSLGGANRNFRD